VVSVGIGHFWIAFFAVGFALGVEYVLFRRANHGGDYLPSPPWYAKYTYALIVLFGLLLVAVMLSEYRFQHFSRLAESFLSGHLYFLEVPGGIGDTVRFNGHLYWPLGPFPAVLLMPLAWVASTLGLVLYQGLPQALLTVGIFLLVRQAARRLGYTGYEALVWAFAFVFATMFLGVGLLSKSWYFAQVVATFLLWWTLSEHLGKRRYRLMGVLVGCLLATRMTAALIAVFFLLDLFLIGDLSRRQKWVSALQLLAPCLVAVVLVGLYNHARFGSPTETGYAIQVTGDFLLASRAYGVFSLAHIPGNLYFSLLSGPQPSFVGDTSQVLRFPFIEGNPYGMSIFVTSPYMLLLFLLSYRDRFSRFGLLTVVVIAIPIICYYGVGFSQLGYRYALDFWPLLFLLFMRGYHQRRERLSGRLQLAIVASSLVNLYLFLTIFAINHPLIRFP